MTPPREVTPSIVLAFVAQLVEASRSRAVNAQAHALAELLRVARACSGLGAFTPAAPADEVRRTLNKDGLGYAFVVEGKFARFTLFDVTGDDAMAHLEAKDLGKLIADARSVLAAMEARR